MVRSYAAVESLQSLSCFSPHVDEHIQRIHNELGPMKKRLSDVEQEHAQAKRRATESRKEMLDKLTPIRSGFRGEPRRKDVVTILTAVRSTLTRSEEESEGTVRPPTIQQGMPSPRIRQYIKGTVSFYSKLVTCESYLVPRVL